MNPRLTVVAGQRGGWFTRDDARVAGYADTEIRRRVQAGRWRRLCRDAYVDAESEPAEEKPWERAVRLHSLKAAVVGHRMHDGVALSHQTATVLHGLPIWSLDLERVHVTTATGRSRSDRLAVVHHAKVPSDDVDRSGGRRLVTPARAVVETACATSYEAAVVLFDAAVREGKATPAELCAMADRFRKRAGSPHARSAAAFVDGRSESVGESRLRVLMANQGLPTPELQADIRDRDGNLVGRVDFLFADERVVVEFDGETKYAAGAADVVVAEKWREDRIRALGYLVVRVCWDDLERPSLTAKRIRQAFGIACAA